jgi:hypothetical protein
MPFDRKNAQERTVELGAYWGNQIPAMQYQIMPSAWQRLGRALIILSATAVGTCGILACFIAVILLQGG